MSILERALAKRSSSKALRAAVREDEKERTPGALCQRLDALTERLERHDVRLPELTASLNRMGALLTELTKSPTAGSPERDTYGLRQSIRVHLRAMERLLAAHEQVAVVELDEQRAGRVSRLKQELGWFNEATLVPWLMREEESRRDWLDIVSLRAVGPMERNARRRDLFVG